MSTANGYLKEKSRKRLAITHFLNSAKFSLIKNRCVKRNPVKKTIENWMENQDLHWGWQQTVTLLWRYDRCVCVFACALPLSMLLTWLGRVQLVLPILRFRVLFLCILEFRKLWLHFGLALPWRNMRKYIWLRKSTSILIECSVFNY